MLVAPVVEQTEEWILRELSDFGRSHKFNGDFCQHPYLIRPKHFMVLGAKKEAWDSDAGRRRGIRVDIQLHPPMDWDPLNDRSLQAFGVEDVKKDIKKKEQWFLWDLWKRKLGNRAGKKNEKFMNAVHSALNDPSLSKKEKHDIRISTFGVEDEGFFPGPGIDSVFLEQAKEAQKASFKQVLDPKKTNPYLSGDIQKRLPNQEHVDYIMIKVKDAPKDEAFIEQVGRERRYAFEVDAKKLWSTETGPTLGRMFECGEWLWPK